MTEPITVLSTKPKRVVEFTPKPIGKLSLNKFKIRFAFALLMTLNLTACAWDNTDRALFAGYIAASAVDCLQTRYILEHDRNEMNPILSSFKPEHTPYYFIATDILVYFLADSLPKYRTAILSGGISLELYAIGNNLGAGVGFEF